MSAQPESRKGKKSSLNDGILDDKSSLWTLRICELILSFFFRLYINIEEWYSIWDLNLHGISHTPTEKGLMLKYMHCWYFFRHMPFPSFIYCHEMPSRQPRLFVSFLWWQVFFERNFYWSETFEYASHASSVATSTTSTLLPGVINIIRWLPHHPSWVKAGKLNF